MERNESKSTEMKIKVSKHYVTRFIPESHGQRPSLDNKPTSKLGFLESFGHNLGQTCQNICQIPNKKIKTENISEIHTRFGLI